MDDTNGRCCNCDECIEKTKLRSIPKLYTINVCLNRITELNLSASNITEVPDLIGNLVCIVKLDLSSNELVTLPYSFAKFRYLTDLVLSHNQFERVPKCLIDGAPSIVTLDLSHNRLLDINIKPCCVQRLVDLNVSNNSQLNSIPQWLWSIECNSLESLDISFTNCLENIQEDRYQNMYGIGEHLKNLNATNTDSDVHKLHFVKYLKNIRTVILDNKMGLIVEKNRNYFSNIPLVFNYRFKRITNLSMSNVDLSTIGKHAYFSFPNLRFLNLSYNSITSLPNSISELTNLEVCDFSHNQILTIPECFKSLKNLKELILHNNWLSTFPKILDDLSNLQFLDLYANKFVICPSFNLNSNIKSLDLEQNVFSTENNIDQNIKDNYSELLKNLRLSINQDRITGPTVHTEEPNDLSSSDESIRSSVCGPVYSTSEYNSSIEMDNQDDVNFKLEEIWDYNTYEHTTDVFDPNEFKLVLMNELMQPEKPSDVFDEKTREKNFMRLTNEHYFCPSDEFPRKF